MVLKKIILQNRYVELETPPPFMEKTILNFHFIIYPTFFLLQLNPTYMKRILHLKNITFKSSYNWFKIDIHHQLRLGGHFGGGQFPDIGVQSAEKMQKVKKVGFCK